jgi:2-polyprenyl-3-methyl-5-hydroxy-6-metoxy-1,4-benzoquinol methylase
MHNKYYKNYCMDLQLQGDEKDRVIAEHIAKHKDEFPEWYMPIQLGKHTIPSRTYPSFHDRPESLKDNTLGQLKWDFIIKKNLPDLKGKRVCDVGCNVGVFSLNMYDLGAIMVDGYDRGHDIIQPNNAHLGNQNVAAQAYFVRNLYEAYFNQGYSHVNFFDVDLMTVDFSKFDYDVFFSCCTLYHLGAERMNRIIKDISKRIPEVFIQANNGHGGGLGKLSSLEYNISLLKTYEYKIIRVDNPEGYPHPVIYASK